MRRSNPDRLSERGIEILSRVEHLLRWFLEAEKDQQYQADSFKSGHSGGNAPGSNGGSSESREYADQPLPSVFRENFRLLSTIKSVERIIEESESKMSQAHSDGSKERSEEALAKVKALVHQYLDSIRKSQASEAYVGQDKRRNRKQIPYPSNEPSKQHERRSEGMTEEEARTEEALKAFHRPQKEEKTKQNVSFQSGLDAKAAHARGDVLDYAPSTPCNHHNQNQSTGQNPSEVKGKGSRV